MKYSFNLQLFAKQKTSTSTSSTGGSSTTGGSTSSTTGSSNSTTTGSSSSTTTGSSQTSSHSTGGSSGSSQTVSGATGKVEAQTQAMRDQMMGGYNQGDKVTDTYNRLQATLDQKPGFQSQYESKLNDLYNSIMNREKFSYDFNADAMYQMYKDQYAKSGKTAMQDTIAQANAMNGGYGSSYSQTAGQQTYQNYLQQLNNMIPTLRDQAYQQYKDEDSRLMQQYNLTNDAYNREYGQYRDQVSDWQADRGFNQSAYQDERNFDYSQFTNDRNFWNQEYWAEKNAQQTSNSTNKSTNWSDSKSNTTSNSKTDTTSQSNTSTSSSSNTNSTNWQDGKTWNNSNSTSTYNGTGTSGSSSYNSLYDDKTNTGYQPYDRSSGWYDTVTNNMALSVGKDTKIDPTEASKYSSAGANEGGHSVIVDRNSAPFNINRNGNLTKMSDKDVIEMAQLLKQDIASDPDNQRAIIQDYQKGLGLTDAEMEWVLEFGRNNLNKNKKIDWQSNNYVAPWETYR